MQHNRLTIMDIAETITVALASKFFLNESVIVTATRQAGKITHCSKDTYKITTPDNETLEVPFASLQRKNAVQYEDIFMFLECVTKQTAFGRILIENVFEKIAQPDFGLEMEAFKYAVPEYCPPVMQSYAEAEESLKMKRAAQHGPDDEADESAMAAARKEQKQKYPKLSLDDLSRITINNYEGKMLKKLVKIHVLMTSFGESFEISKFTLEEVAKAVADPEYASELVFKIHHALVSNIEREIKAKKDRFYDTISFIIERLPEYEPESPLLTPKKRVPMTLENWKAQTKAFLQGLGKDLEDDKVLRFCAFAKKDQLALRLEFLIFLIDIVTQTDRFREFVTIKQNTLRTDKAKHDQLALLRKKRSGASEAEIEALEKELEDYDSRMLCHPLRIHQGKYKNYLIFVMDGKVILKDGDAFYELTKDNIVSIIRDMNLHCKSDKRTSLNLRMCIDVLFGGH